MQDIFMMICERATLDFAQYDRAARRHALPVTPSPAYRFFLYFIHRRAAAESHCTFTAARGHAAQLHARASAQAPPRAASSFRHAGFKRQQEMSCRHFRRLRGAVASSSRRAAPSGRPALAIYIARQPQSWGRRARRRSRHFSDAEARRAATSFRRRRHLFARQHGLGLFHNIASY